MRKLSIVTTIVLVLFTFNATIVNAKATNKSDPIALQSATKSNELKVLQVRLNAITKMDKTDLSKTELNQLLNEVKDIKTQMKEIDGGLYISAGALIVILIVLLFLI